MSDFSTTKGVRARKQHTCSECRGNIHTGTRYLLISGASEGQGYSFKRCYECHLAFTWLELTLRADPNGMPLDEGIGFGLLRCELVDYASETRYVDAEPLRHLTGMAERYAAAQNTSEAQ